MKFNKLYFLAVAFLSITFIAQAQRGVRIGYIDMEYILESVPEYQEAQTQLEGKVQRWKKDIDKMQKEIDQMKLDLANERVLLTKELIDERDEEIKFKEDEMLDYQQARFGPRGDLLIQKRQLIQPIQDQVFNIVQEVAVNKKYDFIFDKSADVVMLFAAERNDISDIVLRSINRATKRTQATSKKDKDSIEKRDALSMDEDKEVTERDTAAEAKKDERMSLLEKRQQERDSIRAAKKAIFDAKRARLLEERQQRKDSILNARNGGTPPPGPPAGEDSEEEEDGGDGGRK